MKYILAVLLAFGLYQWYSIGSEDPSGFTGDAHDKLIMYSLTSCGNCKVKAKELKAAGIPYVEYYIDKDQDRNDELKEKMFSSESSGKGYNFPVFDAYGYMLLNNPSLTEILSARVLSHKYITMQYLMPLGPRPYPA